MSFVNLCGEGDSPCGYCKDDGRKTFGFLSKKMNSEFYQNIIDRGWRRSGTYCYKPKNQTICCPQYTIKCDTSQFCISRTQRKVMKNITDYLNSDIKNNTKLTISHPNSFNTKLPSGDEIKNCIKSNDIYSKVECVGDISSPKISLIKEKKLNSPSLNTSNTIQPKKIKAKLRRYERKLEKLKIYCENNNLSYEEELENYQKRVLFRQSRNKTKSIEYYFSQIKERSDAKHFIEIRTLKTDSPSFDSTFNESFKLFKKYQTKIHKEPEDEVTEKGFRRFLIDSPLKEKRGASLDHGEFSFGTYHQQYWLDDKNLIAVGVIDILPNCLSSVYLFYDPDYAFLRLGVFSALQEIKFVRQIQSRIKDEKSLKHLKNFKFYYMGYYIHSCVKMKYKGAYKPSYLACPITFKWIPIEKCRILLDNSKFCRFSQESEEDENSIENLSDIEKRIWIRLSNKSNSSYQDLTLRDVKSYLFPSFIEIILDWAKLVGRFALDKNCFIEI